MAAVAGEFRNSNPGTPAILTIADGLRGTDTYELLFQHDDWITATGVANQLVRRGQAFCVTDNWGFMFGHEYECRAGTTPRKVVITDDRLVRPGPAAFEVAGGDRHGGSVGAQRGILRGRVRAGRQSLLERAECQPRLHAGAGCGGGGIPGDGDRVGAAVPAGRSFDQRPPVGSGGWHLEVEHEFRGRGASGCGRERSIR